MMLKVGELGWVGEKAWSFLDDQGRARKQFFVTQEGHTPISLRITMVLGAALIDDEFAQVHAEVQRQNPGREVVWTHTQVRPR